MPDHFTGSKGGSGVAQWLISLMPVHRVYVEAFAGRGKVIRTKRQAELNIAIDIDGTAFESAEAVFGLKAGHFNIHGDALTMLPALKTDRDWLIYADPPYLASTRSCKRKYYKAELMTEDEHDRLLSVLTGLQANVMISGYRSELYSRRLADWRLSTFWTVNRRGKRVEECCWMNFPSPARLHDPRFAGSNFTDRQRIKRKTERWVKKFSAMSAGEQSQILEALKATISAAADPIAENGHARGHSCNGSQPQLL
jgi:DNA adenine methylase